MLARCARCQGTFTTDRYGHQVCPHCGAELILPEPEPGAGRGAPPGPPAGAGGGEPAAPGGPPPAAGPSAAPTPPVGGSELPPPPGPPPGGYPPPGAWRPPPAAGGWGPYPPPPTFGPELPSPFAERDRRGLLAAFFETWKLVATQPQQFFGRVRIDQSGAAVLFGVIASTVGNGAAALYGYFSGQQAIGALRPMMENLRDDQSRLLELYAQALSGRATLAQVVLTPLLAVIGIYVGAAILHLLLRLFRGASRGFDATLTAVAYVNGLNLLLAVPGCGWLLAGVWGLVAVVIGLGAVQRCGTGKAAAAVLAPAVLGCACCCAIAGLAAPGVLEGLKQAGEQAPTTSF